MNTSVLLEYSINGFKEVNKSMSLIKKISWHWNNFKQTYLAKPILFQEEDFEDRESFREDYIKIADMLNQQLEFNTVMDVGCANGFLLEALIDLNKDARGIELSPEVVNVLPERLKKLVEIKDFRELTGSYDFVSCVEVAEHIPPYRSKDLVKALVGAAKGSIFFTAAGPGQTGVGHINCRPHSDWLEMFADHGWENDSAKTESIRTELKKLPTVSWLHFNAFILRPNK